MAATNKPKKLGRPTTGWKRAVEVKLPTDVEPGDVLILADDERNVENLVLVQSLRHLPPGSLASGFYYSYCGLDGKCEYKAREMLVWDFEMARGGVFKTERDPEAMTAEEWRDLARLEAHNRLWGG